MFSMWSLSLQVSEQLLYTTLLVPWPLN